MSLETFLPIFIVFVVVFMTIMITTAVKSANKKENGQKSMAETKVSLDAGDRAHEVVEATQAAAPKEHGTNGARPKQIVVGKSHHEQHCAVEHEDEDLYVVEEVPVSGSIEGESEEGCSEHYNLRFVKIVKDDEEGDKIAISEDDVKKAIVFGEVFNDPAYKKF